MAYMPKIVLGRIKNTGYPIDGKEVYLSQWDYDNNEHFFLAGWNDDAEEAVLKTLFFADIMGADDYDEFVEAWKSGAYIPDESFCLDPENVEVLEIIQKGKHPKASSTGK